MSAYGLLAIIAVPTAAGVLTLSVPRSAKAWIKFLALAATVADVLLAIELFPGQLWYSVPWAGGYGMVFALRLYHFSAFLLLATGVFALLVTLYCTAFLEGRQLSKQFYAFLLLSLAMVNGALLADNLGLLLFFWEASALTLFGMIIIGHPGAYRTAVKALIITGVTDLCMMFGIGMAYHLSGTMGISQISLPLDRMGSIAFLLIATGALSKAGCMPFHSWIPDAALDAPLPFMAFLPAALEKLLGIYLLARLCLDMFRLTAGAWVSTVLMVTGAATILLAVAMALIQKDYKRLLSYHAVSQVGYMVLGIGTATPVGIVGGLFHMINHALYKSCLFLTAGSVERQAGTTELSKLGGLARRMPATMSCFVVAAAAISGTPPLNGFFSKELVYAGALERHWAYYAVALLGSFLTAASFLKLGHAAYFGDLRREQAAVKEAPAAMLAPMITIAGFCILFGVYNSLPLRSLIQPILGVRLEGHDFSGFPHSALLVTLTMISLGAACLNHAWGVRRTGASLGAVDHIHHAPVLSQVYRMAEQRYFDPYEIALNFVTAYAKVAFAVDRGVDSVYEVVVVRLNRALTRGFCELQNGSYPTYVLWSLIGAIAVIIASLDGFY
jgi:NADH-quinone oxidoreductase subunit L